MLFKADKNMLFKADKKYSVGRDNIELIEEV